ncbi:MAG: DNA recombination protein RmuC [Tenuifilaceae bacterium]|jgi:DNA recombination protein RmuC|nr:DNA recombination protein RmuC [Tenuifilaceae bacterium]
MRYFDKYLIPMLELPVAILLGLVIGAIVTVLVYKMLLKKNGREENADELKQRLVDAEGTLRVLHDRDERMQLERERLLSETERLAGQREDLGAKLSTQMALLDEVKKHHANLEAELANAKEELKVRVEAFQELSRNYASIKVKAESLNEQLGKQIDENGQLKADVKTLQAALSESKERGVEFDKENKYLKELLEKQKAEIEDLGKKFTNEFKVLADGILEDKSKRFTELNQANIEQLLKPLGENIQIFQKKVEEVYDRESKERFSLGKEVEKLVVLNQRISEEANNLTNALKGQVKQQGNWGEMILESILEKSGLVKDREYFVQESIKDEEGKRFQPDVIVQYPDDRKVIIDSKVSLVAYERYCSSNNPDEQQKELANHIRSIRNHIDILSSKGYQDLVGSLDFVTMFLPVEPAFILAMQADPEIWNYAYSRGVLLLSPTNLIAALRLIHNLWQREYQNRHAMEIAERGGQLYDKFVGFVESLTSVGDNIMRSQKSYEQAMNQLSEGKGNLVNQAQKLKDLGAKAKKSLPSSLLDNDDDIVPVS